MSIQSSFNSALSVASLLWSQSSKVAQHKENLKLQEEQKRQDEKQAQISASRTAMTQDFLKQATEHDMSGDVTSNLQHAEEIASTAEDIAGSWQREFELTANPQAYTNMRELRSTAGNLRATVKTERERLQERADLERQANERIARENEERERIRQTILSGGIQ